MKTRAFALGAAVLLVAAVLTTLLFSGPAQATVSYQSFSTIGPNAGVNSRVVAVPSGTTLNDILIAQVVGTGANPTITAPTSGGWTLVNKTTTSSVTNAFEAVYWKRATSSESAYTWTFSVSGTYAVTILRYSGVSMASNPINASSQRTANSGSITWNSLTPTVAGDMLVALAVARSSGVSFSNPSVGGTALTSRQKQTSAPSFASWDRVLSNTGSTGTFTSTSTTYWVTHDLLLLPQPAPSVTSVSPMTGLATGGTTVTITGAGFTDATAVNFGSNAAVGYTVNSDTSITATSPAGTGIVDVSVTTALGTSPNVAGDNFSYGPVVSSLSPNAGPLSAGTSVIITGAGFTAATSVKFGSTAATVYTVNSGTQITATAPAGSAGTVNVTVTTAAGTSATSGTGDDYTYTAAPNVTSISPTSGVATGGTAVTITGTNLIGATAVRFGSTAATGVIVNSATSITATSPAGTGVVDVTVATAGGTSATGSGDRFSYVPVVSGVAPSAGPLAGGTSVIITGIGFTGASAVKFGTAAATGYTVNSDTQITATAPAGSAGTVDISVTTATGTSAAGGTVDNYTYRAAPTVTNVSPSSGPTAGGTSVTITGTGLSAASAVKFGSTAATGYTVNSDTQITATAPSGSAGTIDITVTTPGGTSATGSADRFTYHAAPTVTGISPDTGPTSGGTEVSITGTGFSSATAVRFGSTAASFTVDSSTSITATSPAGSAGTVDIRVTSVGGTSANSSADNFTYLAAPGISTVSPGSGSVAGGESVTISGTDFTTVSDTTVTFGGTAGTVTTVTSASITVTTPAVDNGGTVDVVVATSGGSATAPAAYTYVGGLSMTTPTVADFASLTLGGVAQTTTANMGTFTVTDSRGAGAGWNVTVQAAQFTSGGHTLPLGSISMPQPTVAKGSPQSTALPTMLPGPYLIDGVSTIKIASAASGGSGQGSYVFTPGPLTLNVPAKTYAGTYTSIVTVSVITGP
jgi:large repetitive protein